MLPSVSESARASAIALALMLSADCTDYRSAATKYATAHATSLAQSTRPLWIKYTALLADVPKSEYTADIRALNPNRVVAGRQGMWMYINSTYLSVTGIFVRYDPSFPTPGTAPTDSVEMTYRKLGPDVYWFSMPR